MAADRINQRIADFQKRFGEAHLYFAYHAAFPFALTPDLAYRLWTNFQRDKDDRLLRSPCGRILQIPWIAVGDLLLSNFCQEVAHELYEMEAPIRAELLRRLRQDERFGATRLIQLAKFIEAYIEQHLRSDDEDVRNFASAQRWVVSAYTKPNQLAAELAEQLAARVRQSDKSGILRLSSLLETVQEPLQAVGLEPLLTYARNMELFARGRLEEPRAYAQKFLQEKQELHVADVPLPIPDELYIDEEGGDSTQNEEFHEHLEKPDDFEDLSELLDTEEQLKHEVFGEIRFQGVQGEGRRRIQPTIVIGLGGTGVKTVTYLKKKLLEEADESSQFVRFLAIDIDELKGDVPSSRLFSEPIRLDPEKNEFFRVTDQTRGESARNIPAVASWFPDEGYKYLPLTEGARQSKPIGRLGFFLAHDDIARRLYKWTDKLVTPEVLVNFPGLRTDQLNVYVVSSICGGTGAGLFLDMAYELRYLQKQAQLPEKSRIKGLFALGDVYDAVSKRVLANTYASLRELNWAQRDDASFHPVYPDGTRDVIKSRAFDGIYLFDDRNKSDIEFSSPDDFAQLCAEFIFLDSGADVQETGDPLSAMMQSNRNNAEVYTMNYDANGTPRCYSAMGLCKIYFPAPRVAQLCAARLSKAIIDFHIIGVLDQGEILELRQRMKNFIADEGLGCNDDNKDLPNRLSQKVTGDRDYHYHIQTRDPFGYPEPNEFLDKWFNENLDAAYNNDVENIKTLDIGRLTHIVQFLSKELNQFQVDMPNRILGELLHFQRILDKAIQDMFAENLGVNFVAKFLEELLQNVKASEEFAQAQMRSFAEHDKRLADSMNYQMKEMGNLLESRWPRFLRGNTQRAQLKDTYKGIRDYFINRINIMKMRAAADFYNGVYDARQKLLEGGEGAISRLTNMRQRISLMKNFSINLAKSFAAAYEENKKITEAPFEILVYDNDRFSTLSEIYDAAYSDSLRAKLFGEILQQIGGSIWNVQQYMDDDPPRLRNVFMNVCAPVFQEQINKKTVAQRILEAKKTLENPIDYHPRIRRAYDLSDYFCPLDDAYRALCGSALFRTIRGLRGGAEKS